MASGWLCAGTPSKGHLHNGGRSARQAVEHAAPPDSGREEDWPTAWTPDNKAVLFVSERDGPSHIFKQDIAKTQPELLVGGNDIASAPRLTPDGLGLLYLVSAKSSPTSDSLRLMRVPVSGGPSRLVLEEPGISGFQCARLPATLCIYGKFEPKSEYFRFFTFIRSSPIPPANGAAAEPMLLAVWSKSTSPTP